MAALQHMTEEGVDHIPVIDDGDRLVGIVTHTDLLRVNSRRFEHESPRLAEPGFLTRAIIELHRAAPPRPPGTVDGAVRRP